VNSQQPDVADDLSSSSRATGRTVDRFDWRRRLASRSALNLTYRIAVGVVGSVVVLVGLITVPLPGPGWLLVFAGLGILATEFDWAARLLRWGRALFDRWMAWIGRQPWWFRTTFGLLVFVFVVGVVWAMLALTGVPSFVPDFIENRLTKLPGL
jgi:uncharacterized protein (TIGR02611 family)